MRPWSSPRKMIDAELGRTAVLRAPGACIPTWDQYIRTGADVKNLSRKQQNRLGESPTSRICDGRHPGCWLNPDIAALQDSRNPFRGCARTQIAVRTGADPVRKVAAAQTLSAADGYPGNRNNCVGLHRDCSPAHS